MFKSRSIAVWCLMISAALTAAAPGAAGAQECPDLHGVFEYRGIEADCRILAPKELTWEEATYGLPLPVDPVHRRMRLPQPGELTIRQDGCSAIRFGFIPADGVTAQTDGALTIDAEEQALSFGEEEVKQWVRQNDERLQIRRKGMADTSCAGAWCGKLYPPRSRWKFTRTEGGALRVRYEYKRRSLWGLLFLTVIPQVDHRELDCVLRPAQ